MNQLSCNSYAKLNLCLHVLDKRKDGFHNIQSIFQPIDLSDQLTFKLKDEVVIELKTNSNNLKLSNNLITKAYNLLHEDFSFQHGLEITLHKNIPIGAGLGGGSSNAACTLLAMDRIFNLNIPQNKLISYAEELGSDVPFFIHNNPMIVSGRGEKLKKVSLPKRFFVLILSDISISTGDIFNCLDSTYYSRPIDDLKLISSTTNCFESLVMSKYPQLLETKYWLSSFGKVRMSGTGSTLYIEFDSYESAREADKEIGKRYKSKMVSSLDSYDIFS